MFSPKGGLKKTHKNPTSGTYRDFLGYITEKIEMSLHAASVNRAGYIIEAIRENYQDDRVRKERQLRAERVREKELEDLEAELKVKRETIIRQVIHAHPELVEAAASHIQSHFVLKRLARHESTMAAYQQGGMVKAEIDSILAEKFCQELLAPVDAAYEDEKARIMVEQGSQ